MTPRFRRRRVCLSSLIGVSRTSLRVSEERQMEATKRAVERIDDISHSNQVFSLKAKYKYKPFHILVKPTATHKSAIRSDEGLTLET